MGKRIIVDSNKKSARRAFKRLLEWNNRPKQDRIVTEENMYNCIVNVASVVEDEVKIGIRLYGIKTRAVFGNAFLSAPCSNVIYYYKDKKKLWTMNHKRIVETILYNEGLRKVLGLEWVEGVPEFIFTKPTIKAIMQGRCTNRDEAVRRYFSAVGVKGMNFKRLSLFKNVFGDRMYEAYYRVTTNLENLVDYKKNREAIYDKDIVGDLVNMSMQLGKKVNFNWSMRRMREEHDKLVKAIVQIKLKYQKHQEIDYSEFTEIPVTNEVTVLNSNSDLLQESCELNHCVGTSDTYFWSMRNFDDIIVRYKNGDVRGTAQISLVNLENQMHDHRVSQFRGRYNSTMPPEDELILDKTLKTEPFQKFFIDLKKRKKYAVENNQEIELVTEDFQRVQDGNLPF